MPIQTIQLQGHIPASQEKAYLHLPFDMPPQAVRLQVDYRYDEQISSNPTVTGGNTIDLGLFDERGIDFLSAGFRGWSGSERSQVWIEDGAAAPGYLPGELNPGVWNVFLGLYKLAPGGCNYQVTVRITTQPGLAPRHKPPSFAPTQSLPGKLPEGSRGPWLCGELHCHTWHSDGSLTPQQLVERARQRGLEFLAVSDHNTTASQPDLEAIADPGLILIRGVEVTTFKGHFNVWGIPHWIDFRVQSPEDMRAALQYADRLGALTSCGHPKPLGPDWDYREVDHFQCVEVWNGPWTGLNEMSLEYWVGLLASGRRISAVGGSDFHRPGQHAGGKERNLGTPTNWVYLPEQKDAANTLLAIRNGRVSLSSEPDGSFIDLRAGSGSTSLPGDVLSVAPSNQLPVRIQCLRASGSRLLLLNQQQTLLDQPLHSDDQTLELALPAASSLFIRAEIRDKEEQMRALSNPIYIQPPPHAKN